MNYIPSVNIETGISKDFQYIVTPNVQTVLGQIISSYHSGNHSFTVIGTYGTGKSSFLMALERDLKGDSQTLVENQDIFVKDICEYEFLNILGDYAPLCKLIADKIECENIEDTRTIITNLSKYYKNIAKKGKFLVIVIDEFGKILEHASKNEPEKELYFLQRLAEFSNDPHRNILLLTTLHQNFGAYAQKLDDTQRQEWNKVKGRFKEVVFTEPIEQLLYMASRKLGDVERTIKNKSGFLELLKAAKGSKFVSDNLSSEIALKLYPLDPFAANCLTQSIQRYGQNERTLFSFLAAKGLGSLSEFEPKYYVTYNLSHVYDYITYTFFSALSEANSDSMSWSAIRESLDRVESGILQQDLIEDARKLVKSIGLMNLFGGSGVTISKELLKLYCILALGIDNPEIIINKLISFKVIRYAAYKNQYILFEGTDIDIENSLLIAESKVIKPNANVQELGEYIDARVISAVSEYYKKGTPRYFEFIAENEPSVIIPKDDVDGTIHLVFPLNDTSLEKVKDISSSNPNANIYVFFNNVDVIVKHLHQIKKLQYLLDFVVLEDRVAKREVNNLLEFEKHHLNEAINASIVSKNKAVTWIFQGKEYLINNQGALKKLISKVCSIVYFKTPVIKNELFNKQKVSSSIALARVNLLDALLEHSSEEDLGFDPKSFPPEKTIYYSLLKSTGIHRQSATSAYELGDPSDEGIRDLWNASIDFIQSTIERPRRLGEFIKILKSAPFKLKQGVIDFWLPIFLFIKQQDFALYNEDGVFVIRITKEIFELLQKKPNDFTVKAFDISGVKMEFFRQYRKPLRNNGEVEFSADTFLETVKPYFGFYKRLNEYAKHTRKFDHPETAKFRDLLSSAKDPEKTFFIDLPEALGFKNDDLNSNEEFANAYSDRIMSAMKELNMCYSNLIDRIEACVCNALDLSRDFEIYKNEIETRYSAVKKELLTSKNRMFFERIMAPSNTKREFWEKVSNAIIDKRLDQLQDKEEPFLMDNLLFMFRELDRYVDISQLDDFMTNDEAYSFEMLSSKGESHKQQTYRLSAGQIAQASKIEKQVLSKLTGDDNLDVCILLRLLNEKIGKKK